MLININKLIFYIRQILGIFAKNESNALYEKIFTTIVVVIGLAIYECR